MDTHESVMLEHLRSGRARLRMCDAVGAIAEWKEAMALAYSAQRYSIAFVVSKNLGDAHVIIAKTASAPALYVEKLREAQEYFAYALGIVKTCALEDVIECQPALRQCVDYIERRHRRIESSIDKATRRAVAPSFQQAQEDGDDDGEEDAPIPCTIDDDVDSAGNVCTTCESSGTTENPIIMDEADGCWYCKLCFDAYYQQSIEVTSFDAEEAKHIEEPVEDAVEECCTGDRESQAESEAEAVETIDAQDESAVEESSVRLPVTPEEIKHSNGDLAVVESSVNEEDASSTDDTSVSEATQVTSTMSRLVYDIAFLRSLRHRGVSESPDIARVANLCSSVITTPVTPRKPTTKSKKKKSKTCAPPTRASQPPTASSSHSTTGTLLPTVDQVESLQTLSLPLPSADEWAVELFSDTFPQQVSMMQSVARE